MGHLISKDGLKAQPAKIIVVLEMPTPTDVTSLRRFIGFTNYLSILSQSHFLISYFHPLESDLLEDTRSATMIRKLKEKFARHVISEMCLSVTAHS